jgi:hypothetical protein
MKQSQIAFKSGHLEEAASLLQRTKDICRHIPDPMYLNVVSHSLANVHQAQHKIDQEVTQRQFVFDSLVAAAADDSDPDAHRLARNMSLPLCVALIQQQHFEQSVAVAHSAQQLSGGKSCHAEWHVKSLFLQGIAHMYLSQV